MDTENRLIVVKGKGAGDWVRRVKELSKEKQKKKNSWMQTTVW